MGELTTLVSTTTLPARTLVMLTSFVPTYSPAKSASVTIVSLCKAHTHVHRMRLLVLAVNVVTRGDDQHRIGGASWYDVMAV